MQLNWRVKEKLSDLKKSRTTEVRTGYSYTVVPRSDAHSPVTSGSDLCAQFRSAAIYIFTIKKEHKKQIEEIQTCYIFFIPLFIYFTFLSIS